MTRCPPQARSGPRLYDKATNPNLDFLVEVHTHFIAMILCCKMVRMVSELMTRLVHRRVRSASAVDHLFHVFQNKFTPKQESNHQKECDGQFCYLILIQQCQPGGHFFSKFENLKQTSSRLNLTSQDSHSISIDFSGWW